MMPATLVWLTAALYRAAAKFESSQFQEQVLTLLYPALPLISPTTVQNYLAHAYSKLKINNKAQLLKQLAEADDQFAMGMDLESNSKES